MTAQEDTQQKLLPKEPFDLPKPHEELPKQSEEVSPQTATPSSTFQGSHAAHEVRTLLSWHAPGRPFRKRNKEYYVNVLLIMLAIQVILFLFSQYLLMLVVLTLVFLNFALVTVPPHDFRYRISTEGITVEDHFFLWQELYDFYFKRTDGVDVLHLRTKAFIPGELMITLGEMTKDHVKQVLLPYLPYREVVTPTFMEKSGDWLAKTFPLEKSPHASS